MEKLSPIVFFCSNFILLSSINGYLRLLLQFENPNIPTAQISNKDEQFEQQAV